MKNYSSSLLHTLVYRGSFFISLVLLCACQSKPSERDCERCIGPQTNKPSKHTTPNNLAQDLAVICKMPSRYQGQVVGDGHCVSLIKECTNIPATKHWRPGIWVNNSQIEKGTIIATFLKGRYPNIHGHHAAIYISHDANGIWVWDQWKGKTVHKRLIRFNNDDRRPANSAEAYRVVTISD